jgi:acetylornithine/succinyldiaminopimelate/putrescine aminotransferase
VIPYGEFVLDVQVKLSQKLTGLLPAGLDNLYLVNSGAEANEGALKLAKRYTGRREIIAFDKSYHGSTHGSLSVTGNEKKKNAFRPLLPGIRFLPYNTIDHLGQISHSTAGVIIEPVQGDAGVRIPSDEFMLALRKRCDDTGALLIFDEIQTGFGRTGKMFAFEHFDVVPDVLTIAKAFGGGMPIGGLVSSRKIMTSLSHDPILGHITTFGGHPVACAAALANLEVLTGESLVEGVESKGKLFESLLKHPSIKEIRRMGLMMAVEFENEEIVQRIVQKCLEKGVITFWFLSTADSFRISPPLTITAEEIEMACEMILQAIREVKS